MAERLEAARGTMIKIENLEKRYGDTHALRGVSLEVGKGEIFAYLGPNGSGKTTTIRILTGLSRASGGDAWLNGKHTEREPLLAKRQCGLVPQAINLDQDLTVEQNLEIHGRLFNMPRAERRDRVAELLEYVEVADRRKSEVRSLSGGMRRRVMIARALMHSPEILFLDEPTVGLDPSIRRRVWSLIKRIQRDGGTIFLTTHYIEEAEFLAGRVAFLDEGRVVALDSPSALMERQGGWAVDAMSEDEMATEYFASRDEARSRVAARSGGFTLRRVNLEDAFLALTGKRVSEAGPPGDAATGGHPRGGHGGHGGHMGHGGHGGHMGHGHGGNGGGGHP